MAKWKEVKTRPIRTRQGHFKSAGDRVRVSTYDVVEMYDEGFQSGRIPMEQFEPERKENAWQAIRRTLKRIGRGMPGRRQGRSEESPPSIVRRMPRSSRKS